LAALAAGATVFDFERRGSLVERMAVVAVEMMVAVVVVMMEVVLTLMPVKEQPESWVVDVVSDWHLCLANRLQVVVLECDSEFDPVHHSMVDW
jgi:hypothetical protein